MHDSTPYSLPLGAKGIDFHEAVLMCARDKIVLSRRHAKEHFTVHFGPHSGELDIHKTTRAPDGSFAHQRLYSIPHDRLAQLLEDIAPKVLDVFMKSVQPLDLRTLAKKRVVVVVGLLMTTAEIETVTDVRDGKLVLNPDKIAARAWIPEFLDELHELKDGEFFTLFEDRRHAPRIVGHGFALTDAEGRHHLLRLSSRRLAAEIDRMTGLLLEAAAKYGTRYDTLSASAT
jgi:hypothetical protein